MNNTILQVNELKTYFFTPLGVVKAVDGVSFGLGKGECLCLVGESGCGKTATALSILRLVDSPPGRIVGGEIQYHAEDLLQSPISRLRRIRGNRIAMIFQDPQSSLNPVFTVGDQIMEPIRLHMKLGHRQAHDRALRLMEQVGIPQAKERMKYYPHQLSGGMKQRVMIASALSCDPEILIADEPTTALDTTIKAQILDIFRDLKQKKDMSILFITHDMGTVAGIADRIIVMYGGRIAEAGSVLDIFDWPKHPYTWGLLNCLPAISERREKLSPIPGVIPSLIDPPEGCIFYPRCPRRMPVCQQKRPEEFTISGGHIAACYLYA
ncbi:MAG TPA: ABC transporter ATP-binding protein [Dehalococcoidales bacterium]|nr:ABC transporter ATP-binding protein [Dehalococcoidales bacterium]